ncbi:MAG: TldD/PmbA family protein [FCB group bacterium]|nr:TldD/PmbA family protein [FCB group bacterium]
MPDKTKTQEILQKAINLSPADQTEVVLISDRFRLTRFAESVIHQNIANEETRLIVTTVADKKVGIATTNDLSPAGIEGAVSTAMRISSLQEADERFESFPTPEMAPPLEKTVFVEPNLNFNADDMAGAVSGIVKMAGSKDLEAAGAFRHEIQTVGIANSLGVEQFGQFGKSEMSLTVNGQEDNSGYAIGFNPDPAKIDFQAVAERAIKKAEASTDPVTLPDGKFTVILEPAAVGQLLLFLGFLGFGGRTMLQRRSFLSGKTGELITGENITITDEPENPAFGSLLFDFEGIRRQSIKPIDQGKAGDGAFDSYYAAQMGVTPTGHALPPDNSYGPYPKNLAIAPGKATVEEMIASTERGVLITHFWYINFLNPMRTMITGTTLDGTFLIENGKVGSAIKNMRTNQSILEAFSNVEMISRNRVVYPQYSSLLLVPAMKINGFDLVQETKEEWEGKC